MFLWGEGKEKRQLGRPRCRWKNNIKMAVQEVGWGRMDRPAGPTTNTARLSPRYEGKTRGCHCSH